nr:biotin/lipoyl-containing protein [Campylobacter hyointestinalis]
MPAGVFKILVKVGDTVGKGQTLIILEAMKMEIPIESPNAGVVSEILVSQGETVEDGQVLLKL